MSYFVLVCVDHFSLIENLKLQRAESDHSAETDGHGEFSDENVQKQSQLTVATTTAIKLRV